MKSFAEYIQQLAEEHKKIKHSDKECHFSDLNDDAQNGYAHMRMHFPCVVLEESETTFSDTGELFLKRTSNIILVLNHVRDAGDAEEVRKVFKDTEEIAIDFVKRMHREKKTVARMTRFDINSVEMVRVYLQDAGLYGYAVTLVDNMSISDIDCYDAFVKNEPETVTAG